MHLTHSIPRLRAARRIVAATSLLALAACGSPDATDTATTGTISVKNCGATVQVPHPPHRVMLTGAEAVPTLSELGVLDSVAVRAGVFPPSYFDATTNTRLADIPSLTDRVDTTGHLHISMEQVLAENPDLVLGATDTINRQTLKPHGIALLDEPAFCGAIDGPVTWDDVWRQIDQYGRVFDKEATAKEFIGRLKSQLKDVEKRAETRSQDRELTVAVLYPEVGGTTTYAYGNRSMSHPMVESAGLRNVFGDVDDRVFEVSAEDILARNPDVIVALHTDGAPSQVTDAVTSLRGISAVPAVQNHRVMPLLLNYAEPATPLSVQGVQKLEKFVEESTNR